MNTGDLHTILDYIRFAATQFEVNQLFFGHTTLSALQDAKFLILSTLRLDYDIDDIYLQSSLTLEEREQLTEQVNSRINFRVPSAYLVGFALYAGFRFFVDERVIIPRSPIGFILQNDEFIRGLNMDAPVQILDMCTGSGCLAIIAAHQFTDAQVYAADISFDAIDVVISNIEAYNLEHRVFPIQSDGFDEIDGLFDLIICNPPYVDKNDLQHMPEEYHAEPIIALTGGDNGLVVVQRLLTEASAYLTQHGRLIMEVGNSVTQLVEIYPNVAFKWLDYDAGVFIIDRTQLLDI